MASLANGKDGNKNGAPQLTEDISISSGLGNDDGIELNGGSLLASNPSEEELEKQRRNQEYQEELVKIQEDIATLRLVLNDKLKRETELKNLLGVTLVAEIKQDFAESFNQIKASTAFQKAAQTFSDIGTSMTHNDAYQKTSAGIKTATQRITPAFTSIGGTVKNSLGSLKNSSMYKSFEAGLGSTLGSVQGRMKNSQSEFQVDTSSNGSSTMKSSQSTLGTTINTSNGANKQETIPEDKEKN